MLGQLGGADRAVAPPARLRRRDGHELVAVEGVTVSSRSRSSRLTSPTSGSLATSARAVSDAVPVTTTRSMAGKRARKHRTARGSR